MKTYFLYVLVLMFWACSQKDTSKKDGLPGMTDAPSDTAQSSGESCYAFINEKDTVQLHIVQKHDGKVKGTLTYRLFEKDANSGEIEGKMLGDTLIALYNFTSEGRLSKREVAFLFKDNLVLEGYGPLKEEGDMLRFESLESLEYGNGIELLQVRCEEEY